MKASEEDVAILKELLKAASVPELKALRTKLYNAEQSVKALQKDKVALVAELKAARARIHDLETHPVIALPQEKKEANDNG